MTSPGSAPSGAAVVDLRRQLRPVGDQGRRGTCVAFAVTAIHEADRGPADGSDDPDDLSEEVLFWGAKQIDDDTADGTRFGSADAALQRWGQPDEAWWPYDGGRDHRAASYVPPPGALEPENCHVSALRPIVVDHGGLRGELDAGRPVVLGIPVWDRLRFATIEPLPPPTPAEIYPTRHAVVAVSYNPGSAAILIRNSWGPRWGNNGHLWVSDGLLAHVTGSWVVDADAAHVAASSPDEEELLE
jgi:C1A family cysteine protease